MIPTVKLNNGVEMPQLGYGVFQVPNDETATAVTHALEAGYSSIDTAAAYQNEAGVGQALVASGIDREDLFITTKLWNADQVYENTLKAFDRSVSLLGLEYLDLYLIHWPTPARDLYADSWRALEKLYADGRVRAIGVSNFQPEHLDRLAQTSGITPALNQVELHPYLQQAEVRAYGSDFGIHTEAWSPLAKGGELLTEPIIATIAKQYDRTPAQIVLRWHLQLGNIVIPKSVTPSRIRENLNVFDFTLSADDVTAIADLDRGERTGPDPDTFNVA
ncbi:aldo/keto reductase [Kribbella sp. NPDC026596]|uniref:aldo/keto reductase n=1 Tax=Kribbella sp. NPDC026596 TaxID=3155122 RepID=UPI0033DF1C2C